MNLNAAIAAPSICATGLNHKTCPVAIRERFAFDENQCRTALVALKRDFDELECVILSTCNRTELYLATQPGGAVPVERVHQWLADHAGIALTSFESCLYTYSGPEAVGHLLRVAASLDSLVIGEPQIMAQVKNAFRLANEQDTTGKTLNRLFHCAFTTSKEIYGTTSIAQRRVSIAGVAVDLAGRKLGDLQQARVVVIGAGEMGELIVKHLQEMKCQSVTVVNRTMLRGHHVANRYQYHSAEWADLPDLAGQADIIIAAAMAQEHLFGTELLASRPAGRPLVIIDIAIPRIFDPAVAALEGVHLYSVDDLAGVAHENMQARQEDLQLARHIVADNIESFMDWFGVMDIGPRIGQMRETFRRLAQIELKRFLTGEPDLSILDKQKMDSLTTRLVNKLVHRLINNFHTIARDFGPDEAARLIDEIIHHKERE